MRSFTNVLQSVLSAFFGVQSDKNRKADFSQGKLSHFIIAGVVITFLFIATLIFIVKLVLSTAY
jgi:hypothetical protein